jgi:serine/threonine protein kinase
MAPEVAMGDGYSEKVDIYSLCATFYYLFKAHGPYFDQTVKSSIDLHHRKMD